MSSLQVLLLCAGDEAEAPSKDEEDTPATATAAKQDAAALALVSRRPASISADDSLLCANLTNEETAELVAVVVPPGPAGQ